MSRTHIRARRARAHVRRVRRGAATPRRMSRTQAFLYRRVMRLLMGATDV